MFRPLLLSAAFCISVAQAAEPAIAWRLAGSATGATRATTGALVVLNSAEVAKDTLTLRIGFRGMGFLGGTFTPPPLFESDVSIEPAGEKQKLACVAVTKSWAAGTVVKLGPRENLIASLRFFAPPRIADKKLLLRIAGFGNIAFQCSDAARLVEPDLSHTPERWELGGAVQGFVPGIENVRMEFGTARVSDDKLTLQLTFRNAGRFPFKLPRSPSGADAVLITSEREFLRHPAITGAIERQIAPAADWVPDMTVTGTVTFPLPHPHARSRLWLAFSGFPDVPLLFDDALRHWRVEQEQLPAAPISFAQVRARAQDDLFASVDAFWQTVTRLLKDKEFAACRALFEKPEDCPLLRSIEKAPLDSLEVQPLSEQILRPDADGALRVHVTVRYRFRGQPEAHEFQLHGGCRMKRMPDAAGWRVESLALNVAPPWAQGYTAFGESGHFLLFYQPAAGDVQEAVVTLEQLEKSWDTITATGLRLENRYAAFLCLNDGDHKLLSGDQSLGMVEASVSGSVVVDKDVFRTVNIAIFVSRSVFRATSALQQRHRLQTALDHEMVHAALSSWTRTWMPGWLVEGVAVHLSGGTHVIRSPLAGPSAAGLTLRSITETGVLRDPKGDSRRVDLQYKLAAETVALITERWGTAKLMKLYQAFSQDFPEAWKGPYGVDYSDENSEPKRRTRIELAEKNLRRVLGTSIDALEDAVRARLRPR